MGADDGVFGEKSPFSLLDVRDVLGERFVLGGFMGGGLDVGLEVHEFPLSLVGGCGCCV